jgi:hypothetical protein
MPRRDGFSTNAELQQQFAFAARDLYVAAFSRDLQHKIPEWFIGKKLGHISLEIVRNCGTPQDIDEPISPNQIARERFIAKAAFSGFTEFVRAEQEVTGIVDPFELLAAQCNDEEAKRYGEAFIVPNFDVSGIPANLVRADYTAIPHNKKRIRHASAIKDKPSKQSLLSGLYFIELAHTGYVQSPDFRKDKTRRLVDAILSGKQVIEYNHHWSIPYSVDVPINGKEPEQYLVGFLEYVVETLARVKMFYQKLITLHAPMIFIEHNNKRIEQLEQKQQEIIDVLQSKRRISEN